jgi:hypothetical protein
MYVQHRSNPAQSGRARPNHPQHSGQPDPRPPGYYLNVRVPYLGFPYPSRWFQAPNASPTHRSCHCRNPPSVQPPHRAPSAGEGEPTGGRVDEGEIVSWIPCPRTYFFCLRSDPSTNPPPVSPIPASTDSSRRAHEFA